MVTKDATAICISQLAKDAATSLKYHAPFRDVLDVAYSTIPHGYNEGNSNNCVPGFARQQK